MVSTISSDVYMSGSQKCGCSVLQSENFIQVVFSSAAMANCNFTRLRALLQERRMRGILADHQPLCSFQLTGEVEAAIESCRS